jgi:hypothetical protein
MFKRLQIANDFRSKDKWSAHSQKILNAFIESKSKQRLSNFYSPDIAQQAKYLIIVACHCNSEIKLRALFQNLPFFHFECVHLLVINSENLEPFTSRLRPFVESLPRTEYLEIPNDPLIDFGKWVTGMKHYGLSDLNTLSESSFDFVVCINDSIILSSPIAFFLNMLPKANKALFGFNDSTQPVDYCYQSYLFALAKRACPRFVSQVENISRQESIRTQEDVINKMEIPLYRWFYPDTSVYLPISSTGLNSHQNIFFTNDIVFRQLQKANLLPIEKIKRFQQDNIFPFSEIV